MPVHISFPHSDSETNVNTWYQNRIVFTFPPQIYTEVFAKILWSSVLEVRLVSEAIFEAQLLSLGAIRARLQPSESQIASALWTYSHNFEFLFKGPESATEVLIAIPELTTKCCWFYALFIKRLMKTKNESAALQIEQSIFPFEWWTFQPSK